MQNFSTPKALVWLTLLTFGLALFVFNFQLLDNPSQLELDKIHALENSKEYFQSPINPLSSTAQTVGQKVAPTKLYVFRLAPALLCLFSILLLALSIPNVTKNKFLPYLFFLFSASSPFFILAAHLGGSQAIELFFCLSLITFVTCRLYNKRRDGTPSTTWDWLILSSALGLLLHQPLGLVFAPIIILLLIARLKLQSSLTDLSIIKRTLVGLPLTISLGLLATSLILHPFSIKELLVAQNFSLDFYYQNLKTTINMTLGLKQFRPFNALFFLSLILLIKGFRSRKVFSLVLLIGLASSIAIAALFPAGQALILVGPFVTTPIALVISELITRTDRLFPRNPYPRFLARTISFGLAIAITLLGLYTFNHATLRQNSTLPSTDHTTELGKNQKS